MGGGGKGGLIVQKLENIYRLFFSPKFHNGYCNMINIEASKNNSNSMGKSTHNPLYFHPQPIEVS